MYPALPVVAERLDYVMTSDVHVHFVTDVQPVRELEPVSLS